MTDMLTDGTANTDTGTEGQTNMAGEVAQANQNAGTQEQGTEADGAKAQNVEDQGDKAKADAEAPVEYNFEFDEGVQVDEALLSEFKTLAAELKLPPAEAQRIAQLAPKLSQKFVEQQQAAMEAVQTEWKNATTSDKEFGGDALGANLAIAKTALDAFGTPELSKFLVATGLGNHPELIRAFVKVGKSISEDKTVVSAGNAAQPKRSAAQTLWPSQSAT